MYADDHIRAVTIDEQRYWRQPAKQYEDLVWTDPAEYAKVCDKRMRRIDGCLELSSAPRDPFNIPELRDLLNQPEKLQRPKTKRQKEREMEQIESAVGRMALKPYIPRRYQSQSNYKVPTEIILMIMEYLDEYPDIFGLIRVFPQHRAMISRAAWRRKCIDVLLLEEALPSAADLDWSYLYSGIMLFLWYFFVLNTKRPLLGCIWLVVKMHFLYLRVAIKLDPQRREYSKANKPDNSICL